MATGLFEASTQMRRRSRISRATVLSALVVLLTAPIASPQSTIPQSASVRTTPDTLADGPHILWRVDPVTGRHSADVWYYCDGEITSSRLPSSDTLWIHDVCTDTSRTYRVLAAPPSVPPAQYSGITRILAVSDIHGEYDELETFLRTAGVIDDSLHWQWDDGHLVVIGDVFDRGDQVTECLWLIHSLEWQAREAGGAVHMLLGNHETIAMRGDERYIHEKYQNGIVKARGQKEPYSYRQLFGPDTELGSWLRTRNTAVVIDSTLFVHGGIAPEVVRRGLTLERINAAAREGLAYLRGDTTTPELPKFIHGSLGPLWYRGWQYALEDRYPEITSAQLDSVLNFYGATAAVSGHSEVDSIMSMHNNQIYFIDIPVDERGGFEGLLRNKGEFYRVKTDGTRIPMQ